MKMLYAINQQLAVEIGELWRHRATGHIHQISKTLPSEIEAISEFDSVPRTYEVEAFYKNFILYQGR